MAENAIKDWRGRIDKRSRVQKAPKAAGPKTAVTPPLRVSPVVKQVKAPEISNELRELRRIRSAMEDTMKEGLAELRSMAQEIAKSNASFFAEMRSIMEKMGKHEGMEKMMAALERHGESMKKLVREPKRVVRDPDTKMVLGIEPGDPRPNKVN